MAEPDRNIPDDYYDAKEITVLKGLDAVRRRPGMCIGNTDDGSGLHNMVNEVVEHAIHEVLIEEAPEVVVQLNSDSSCTVRDNSRGLRTDTHEGVSAAEAIMTTVGGRKFNEAPYWMFGNMDSAGVAVVNTLSTWLKLTIWRDGKEHFIEFRDGDTVAPLREVGSAQGKRGNEVTFLPSPQTFPQTEFDFVTLERGLRKLIVPNSRVRIVLSEIRHTVEKRVEIR